MGTSLPYASAKPTPVGVLAPTSANAVSGSVMLATGPGSAIASISTTALPSRAVIRSGPATVGSVQSAVATPSPPVTVM